LSKPAAGEKLTSGSKYEVVWQSIGNFTHVNIAYLDDEGQWKNVATQAPNSGRYVWQVPEIATATLRVKVSGAEPWVMADTSGVNSIESSTHLKKRVALRAKPSRMSATIAPVNALGKRLRQ
jgi:hypothetical protein